LCNTQLTTQITLSGSCVHSERAESEHHLHTCGTLLLQSALHQCDQLLLICPLPVPMFQEQNYPHFAHTYIYTHSLSPPPPPMQQLTAVAIYSYTALLTKFLSIPTKQQQYKCVILEIIRLDFNVRISEQHITTRYSIYITWTMSICYWHWCNI